jgi:hypothetical protein
MPTDVWFWVVVAAVVAAVLALAIWKNRGINVELGLQGVKVGAQTSKEAPPSGVAKVAEGMSLGENARAGNIVGNEGPSDAFPANQDTEVANQMTVGKGAAVGDIIGNKIVGPSDPRR